MGTCYAPNKVLLHKVLRHLNEKKKQQINTTNKKLFFQVTVFVLIYMSLLQLNTKCVCVCVCMNYQYELYHIS